MKFSSFINDINNNIEEAKTVIKDPITSDLTHGIFYTDGGSNGTHGGWGIHGYLYADGETKSNSGISGIKATKEGYQKVNNKDYEKVIVLCYIDLYGYHEEKTTNNKAELLAMIRVLNLIDELALATAKLYADSKYVLGLIHHREKYIANGFRKADGNELVNTDLIKQLIDSYERASQKTTIEYHWVAGHSGDYGNDLADANATKAKARLANLQNNIDIEGSYLLHRNIEDYHEYINIRNPVTINTVETEPPAMISESFLFHTTNYADTRDDVTYYQVSFGSKMSSKDTDRKKELRGRPFSDACLSVVRLKEPDTVLNKVIDTSNQFSDVGVITSNLSYITRKSIYNDIGNGALADMIIDNVNNRILAVGKNKLEICNLNSPPRLCYRLIDEFNLLNGVLTSYIGGNDKLFEIKLNITDYLFTETTNKKGVVTHELTLTGEDSYVDINIDLHGKNTLLRYIPGIDCPKPASLRKFKHIRPKMELLIFDVTPAQFRYLTIITTDEGIGLWCGIYSNIELL